MKVAGITGPGADRVAREVTERLRASGRVARVRRDDSTTDGGTLVAGGGADTTYALAEDGYRASGSARSLSEVLDDLAADHDYAIVTGHPESAVPHVVVDDGDRDRDRGLHGDLDGDGRVVARVERDDPDIAAAVEAIEATRPHETLESLVARAKRSANANRAGAIATFTGRVRERDDPGDPPTTHLEFEMYDGVAEERMEAIASELEDRAGVFEVVLHHRTGVVEAGQDIVFVVVLAGHREEAFRTVSDGIDRLKEEVPIFKKEVTLEGQFWAHERE